MSKTISKNKVAVKLGDYFDIFDKDQIPNTLAKYNKRVELNNVIYDLYNGTSLEDEKVINNMFEDRRGHSIAEHIVEKPKCALIGEDGNIFHLGGIASRTLKENDLNILSEEMCNRITTEAKSYEQALCIIEEYVEINSREKIEDWEDDEEY